jgi:hypothetical protein
LLYDLAKLCEEFELYSEKKIIEEIIRERGGARFSLVGSFFESSG